MFVRLLGSLQVEPPDQHPGPRWDDPRLLAAEGYAELASQLAGCSFESGLYRLHDARSGPCGQSSIATAFPEFADRAFPFGYDWLGRQFALDSARTAQGELLVLLLDAGSGEALEIPASFRAFHDEELVDHQDAALASDFFKAWADANPSDLPMAADRCVGYRVPLFLGGADELSNLEVVDISVYWELCGQLRLGASSLPEGTSINKITGR